jgi:hypothetical protein
VFSIRYVNDLLAGLEPYRHGKTAMQNDLDGATFSPNNNEDTKLDGDDKSSDEEDDIMDLIESKEAASDGSQDSDAFEDNDGFQDDSERQHLDLDINLESALKTPPRPERVKRRRSSTASGSHVVRRKSTLSASGLVDLWSRLSSLQQTYDFAQMTLDKIEKDCQTPASDLENLVGDELQHAYRQNVRYQEQLDAQRANLHSVAQERHMLEQEAIRFLPWIEQSLKQDEDDLVFCDKLEKEIIAFQKIHGRVKQEHEAQLEEEEKRRKEEEERERIRREEEETEKFRRAALAKQDEAKPGMVWNPVTREYQTLQTDDSWRDH